MGKNLKLRTWTGNSSKRCKRTAQIQGVGGIIKSRKKEKIKIVSGVSPPWQGWFGYPGN